MPEKDKAEPVLESFRRANILTARYILDHSELCVGGDINRDPEFLSLSQQADALGVQLAKIRDSSSV